MLKCKDNDVNTDKVGAFLTSPPSELSVRAFSSVVYHHYYVKKGTSFMWGINYHRGVYCRRKPNSTSACVQLFYSAI